MVARDRGNVVISLSDKRLLSMDEFAIYTSMGANKTRELAEQSGALFRAGRRLLVDRVKFDQWCDKNTEF
jgi:Excisionase from transposon Tn916.